jgi:hypothetical protein
MQAEEQPEIVNNIPTENADCENHDIGGTLPMEETKILDTSHAMETLEFDNIYDTIPPCVRRDIDARVARKKLSRSSPEAIALITHCRDQYRKKREYNRKLGTAVRSQARASKCGETSTSAPTPLSTYVKQAEAVASDYDAEEEEEETSRSTIINN